MRQDRKLVVVARWDDEARVWVATSDDVPGLVTEDKSLDNLVRRVTKVIPELLEDNDHLLDDDIRDLVDVCIISRLDDRHGAAAH